MHVVINAVVLDDNQTDLLKISTALSSKGIATIPIHYEGPPRPNFIKCEGSAKASPRVIITDIQLREGQPEPSKIDMSNVTQCLSKIVSNTKGPYIILAWTSVSSHFETLKETVLKFFKAKGIREPFYFGCICKNDCKPKGTEYCPDTIFEAFNVHLNSNAQFKALLDWEKNSLKAAHETVNELIDTSGNDLNKVLCALGEAVAGNKLKGFEAVAINESLSYLLKDQLGKNCLSTESQALWSKALSPFDNQITELQKHSLNSMLHIDTQTLDDITCPGDVWFVPLGKKETLFFKKFTVGSEAHNNVNAFKSEFVTFSDKGRGLNQQIKAETEKEKKTELQTILTNKFQKPLNDLIKNSQITLVEISPLCDFANNKRKLKSITLGMLVLKEDLADVLQIKGADSIFKIAITLNDREYFLMISSKYVLSLSEAFINLDELSLEKSFRIRENVLLSLIHKVSSYNSRIGTIML